MATKQGFDTHLSQPNCIFDIPARVIRLKRRVSLRERSLKSSHSMWANMSKLQVDNHFSEPAYPAPVNVEPGTGENAINQN